MEKEALLQKLDKHPIIAQVGQVADEQNLDTYIVGGYVRDLLLERESKDIDFVCVGSGIALAKAVKAKLGKSAKLAVYKNFGTAAITHEDFELEFVGARRESYRADSRKPIVEDGSLEDDQNRRDFTINALAIQINTANYGKLIDPFGGVEHLQQKLIKTPLEPEVTFSDDPLRIMRAIRFATQLKFDIAPETFDAIIKQKERISIISQERITDELNKIILADTPSYGFKLLFTCGLLPIIFPEMAKLHGVKKVNGKAHKDNFYHTLQVLDNICADTDSLWLRWAAILHDIAKPATQRFHEKAGWTFHGHEDMGARWVPRIFKKLKLPLNEKMKYVQKLVKLHLRPIALVNEKVTDSAIRRLLYEAGDDIDDLMTLCRADVTSKNPDRVRRYLANFKKVEKKIKEVEERDQVRNFQPPVSGETIIATFGIEPSREVGEIKNGIKEAILEGTIRNNPEEAHELMIKLGKSLGLTPKSN
ncbi:putative nucleotidyltransferase with HDIG domain [Marinoscillum furvescens DSM 4134]|uniref:Putative nucleotidyltransferase with HDIG domain n=2 Tax=Marinoscillum furvescens TaxID=1026 RepID=A0A3D9L0A2_MARFU|nr:HD domain-containing protein [Marinoscillum furvescens]RED94407.1 putative nucleotidyltransferase with HDIG domain [Marinoscillum furvescens DSM 4134]